MITREHTPGPWSHRKTPEGYVVLDSDGDAEIATVHDDNTEAIRRAMTAQINALRLERAALEALYGTVWDTQELQRDFEVIAFLAPFAMVRRHDDGQIGSVLFQHMPRYYFGFMPDECSKSEEHKGGSE